MRAFEKILGDLEVEGWRLVRVERETYSERDTRVDRVTGQVWGALVHSVMTYTSDGVLIRAEYPEDVIANQVRAAWLRLAEPLGVDLGILR